MGGLNFPHGGNIYAVKRIFKKEVIDFSANINPLGLPSRIRGIIYKNFDRFFYYPDPEAENISQKIAKYWGIEKENILIGNGSVELIYLIMSAFSPQTVLIPIPSFSEYERAARNVNARIKFIKLQGKEDFKLNPNQIIDSDILFLSNPNNPTGNVILADCQIVEKLPNRLIVIDEAFMDFLPDESIYTFIWKAQKSKKVIVLRTFTKFFAMPGLRIGYLVGHKDIIQVLKQYQVPWSVNVIAQQAAEYILGDETYINKTRRLIERERNFLFAEVAKIRNLKPYPSVTNFLLIKIENKNLTSSFLTKKLIGRGFLIRDCANFRGLNNKFIRIAVHSHKENLKLLKALKELA